MYDAMTLSPKAGVDVAAAASDLLKSVSRTLILTVAAIWGVCYLAVVVVPVWWDALLPVVWTGVTLLIPSVLAWRLLQRRVLLAQTVWLVGLAVAVTLTAHSQQLPQLLVGYAMLPLLCTLVIGRAGGLISEVLVVLLLFAFSRGWVTPVLEPTGALAIGAVGVFLGVLGWTSTRALLTVTEWSLFHFEEARRRMDEALEQRLELRQTQDDLVQVNNELARLTERLRVLQQMANAARQAKEEFVANVSHELRTPLNMIIGFSEIITRSPQIYGIQLPPALLADIATVQRNSEHLAKLVNDVLDLSQVDAGRMGLTMAWTDLSAIVESALAVVRPLYASKGLGLEADIATDLPQIYCDSTRIRQVIVNLLSNAGRFTEEGSVMVTAYRDGERVVIGVADSGKGISPADQQRLFEPFQQLDASIRRLHGGSGLGLSISQRFVELHGGQIWVESPSPIDLGPGGGPGTYIRFSLPVTDLLTASLDFDDARRWFSPYSGYPYNVRTRRPKAPLPEVKPRYVVLEEGDALGYLLRRYMPESEFRTVSSTEAALEELAHLPADALVVNVASNPADFGRLQSATDLPYGTPLLSCWVPGNDRERRRLGIVRYLVKPIAAQDLLDALMELGVAVRRVLIVDDDPESLQLFARVIASAERRYQILRAETGERALQLLRRRKPDAVLMDLIMPGMDGLQVLHEKAEDPSIQAIPVIITSSRDPRGGPIVSRSLAAAKGEGLSVHELVAGIRALSEILVPSARVECRAPQSAPAV